MIPSAFVFPEGLSTLASKAYASCYAELADRVWEREYLDKAGMDACNEQPRDQLCGTIFMGS
jgi:hypothetical protein